MPQSPGTSFSADPLTFIVRHQLWDANVEDHSDQGVSIEVAGDIDGKLTILLRFNCFDLERSYVYGPENPELTTPGRLGGGMGVHCRMDPITDGNPIGWTIRTLSQKLPKMLERAGYKEIARATDAHYHYGPRNKNHRTNWDMTVIDDPLEWTFEQIENRKLGAMIERAGYPGIAADLDLEQIAAVLPALKKRAFEMYEEGERLTGHKGLPLEFTPNLAAAE